MTPICLIIPPSPFLLDERVFMSLGLLRVAAVLENAGYAVEVVDLSGIQNYQEAMRTHARNTSAKIFAFTATTPQMPSAFEVSRIVEKERPDARLILGGPHPTLTLAAVKKEKVPGRAARALNDLYSGFDVVIAGDGEQAIFGVIKDDAPKLVDADDPKSELFLTDAKLNELPFPARHLVDADSYHYFIEGERAMSLIAQLGCPFQSLTGDALIFTDRGFERLDKLIQGQGDIKVCEHGAQFTLYSVDRQVTTHEGVQPLTSVMQEGMKEVFEVCTENGISVKATAEHPFYCLVDGVPKWKNVSDLKSGDWMILKTPENSWPVEYLKLLPPKDFPAIPPGGFVRKHAKTPDFLTEDVAWLIGYLIGDGCLPKDCRPEVHLCVTEGLEEKIKRIVKQHFDVDIQIYESNATKKMKHGWLRSRAAYSFFVEILGISPEDKLHVPQLIRQSKKTVVEAFLEGLWDADGYLGAENPYLTTVSGDLARDVSALLLMIGKVPNILKASDYYRVSEFLNDRIPTEKSVYRSIKSGRYFWRTFRSDSNLGVRRRTIRDSGLTHTLDRPGWHYVRVEKVVPAGVERVFDLHVPNDHSFLADGLVAHNCGFCGGRNSAMLRRVRTRSTENVVKEMLHLFHTYKVKGFMLYDDELNVNPQMVPLMNAIADAQEALGVQFKLRGFIKSQLFTDEQARAMFRAGFRWILTGFESGSPRILTNINKRATREENSRCVDIARRNGLKVKALMSIGHPGESPETLDETKGWLLENRPEDFDVTIITPYPGSPYYDDAVPCGTSWVYTYQKTGDKLYAKEVDYLKTADYYKGNPDGGYQSYVWTDALSAEELVKGRDKIEFDVRAKLGIPFNPSAPAIRFEHSMGQNLPPNILRASTESSKIF